MDAISPTPEQLAAKAIAALPDKTELFYIDHSDELTNKQIAMIFDGDYDEAQEEVQQNVWDNSDGEDYAISSLLEEALPDADEQEALRTSDAFQTFREACQERDASTPFSDLLANTGRKMVRFHWLDPRHFDHWFNDGYFNMQGDSWRWDAKRVEAAARRLCRRAGLDWATNEKALKELVANATYGGALCVLAYVDVADIAKGINHLCVNPKDLRRHFTVTFDKGEYGLLLIDTMNGSGHDVSVKGSVTFKFNMRSIKAGAIRLDHKVKDDSGRGSGGGYDWSDSIAGVVYTYFKQDPKIAMFPPPAEKTP